jgi:hypothetical protein
MKNPIEDWINNDDNLYNLIIEIQEKNNSPQEQAEIAFNKLCSLYDIPLMPLEMNSGFSSSEEKKISKRSLFEEHALLKFLAPENEDPRGLVLSAAYNIINNKTIDYIEIAKKEYEDHLPDLCQIGISGNNYNSNVIFFEKETEDWTELGCKTITTINKTKL